MLHVRSRVSCSSSCLVFHLSVSSEQLNCSYQFSEKSLQLLSIGLVRPR